MSLSRQSRLVLPPRPRGIHLITADIRAALQGMDVPAQGLLQVFLQHTSAGLLLTENADPDVPLDLMDWLDRMAPASHPGYRHTLEGPDDLPAHLISALTGVSLLLPVTQGKLALGTWQGIALCEPRRHGGARQLLLTVCAV